MKFLELLRMLLSLFLFISILFGAKHATVYWAKRNQYINLEKNIKIIEQVPLTREKSIILINYKGFDYLLATTMQTITIIDKIKVEDMD